MQRSCPSEISARRGSSSWPSAEKASGRYFGVNTFVSRPSGIRSRNSLIIIPQAMLVNALPVEAMSGLEFRLARPKYFSNTSQPLRTTSNPPFWVHRCVNSHAWFSFPKSIPARFRICDASAALRQPPSRSGGGKYSRKVPFPTPMSGASAAPIVHQPERARTKSARPLPETALKMGIMP